MPSATMNRCPRCWKAGRAAGQRHGQRVLVVGTPQPQVAQGHVLQTVLPSSRLRVHEANCQRGVRASSSRKRAGKTSVNSGKVPASPDSQGRPIAPIKPAAKGGKALNGVETARNGVPFPLGRGAVTPSPRLPPSASALLSGLAALGRVTILRPALSTSFARAFPPCLHLPGVCFGRWPPSWLVACTGGCVERQMTIRSDPPGALVYVDGYEIGITPVITPFTYYGQRKIRLVKDGYETLTVIQPVPPPWYEFPGWTSFPRTWCRKDTRRADLRLSACSRRS